MTLLDQHHAFADSWFATNEQDQAKLREFRHQLPVLMNEWFARYNQRKVSTDMAVPDEAFPGLFRLYKDTLASRVVCVTRSLDTSATTTFTSTSFRATMTKALARASCTFSF